MHHLRLTVAAAAAATILVPASVPLAQLRETPKEAARVAIDAARSARSKATQGLEVYREAEAAEQKAKDAVARARRGEAGYGRLTGQSTSGKTWTYEGGIKGGKRDGFGINTWTETGSLVSGGWLGGDTNGFTIERFRSGNMMAYRSQRDRVVGSYYYRFSDGEYYSGDYNQLPRGNRYVGVHFDISGGQLAGSFEADGTQFTKTGYGVYTAPDGIEVAGRFYRGMPNGPGRITNRDGRVAEGTLFQRAPGGEVLIAP